MLSKNIRRTLLAFAGAAVLLASFMDTFPVAYAAEGGAKNNNAERKTRRTPAIREQVYKRLAEAQELLDAKNLVAADNLLKKLLERRGHNGYEKASVHNMLAFLAYTNENYRLAITHYEGVLVDRKNIPQGLEQATLYTLSQLNFIEEDYPQAAHYMKDWFVGKLDPGPNPYIFLAQIYYQLKQYREAIRVVEQAIGIAQSKGLPVKENWWLLLRSMYYEREEYGQVIEILEILVRDFSKREYWVQLSGLYAQEQRESRQIQAIDVAYIGGLLEREREVLNLAGLLMQADVPYRAGVILEQAMEDGLVERNVKNMELLAQAWQISQETSKAIPVLKEAAKSSEDGDLHLYLAQVYLQTDKYDGCVQATLNAIQKGGLKLEGLVYEVQGMCRFNQDLLVKAYDSFKQARSLAQRQRDAVAVRRIDKWLQYIAREQRRLEALRNS